jgi:translation initiation factor IF-1
MSKNSSDLLTIGTIIEINRNVIKVKLTEVSSQPDIFANICGKMKKSHIRLSVGDRVKILIPQASPNLGIIKFREKVNKPA